MSTSSLSFGTKVYTTNSIGDRITRKIHTVYGDYVTFINPKYVEVVETNKVHVSAIEEYV